MVITLLTFDLHILGAASIKDKRRVVKSVKDRLHREHQVSVAEVAYLDAMQVAGMALVLVNRDAAYARSVADSIVSKLRKLHNAELGDHRVEMLTDAAFPGADADELGAPLWDDTDRRGTPE